MFARRLCTRRTSSKRRMTPRQGSASPVLSRAPAWLAASCSSARRRDAATNSFEYGEALKKNRMGTERPRPWLQEYSFIRSARDIRVTCTRNGERRISKRRCYIREDNPNKAARIQLLRFVFEKCSLQGSIAVFRKTKLNVWQCLPRAGRSCV